MSNFTRRTNDQTVTIVEAGENELGYGPAEPSPKNIFTMTTQMEVTWDHQPNPQEQHTSSTESLVHKK